MVKKKTTRNTITSSDTNAFHSLFIVNGIFFLLYSFGFVSFSLFFLCFSSSSFLLSVKIVAKFVIAVVTAQQYQKILKLNNNNRLDLLNANYVIFSMWFDPCQHHVQLCPMWPVWKKTTELLVLGKSWRLHGLGFEFWRLKNGYHKTKRPWTCLDRLNFEENMEILPASEQHYKEWHVGYWIL